MGNEKETKNNIQFRYDSDTKTLFLRGSGPIKDFAIIDSLYSDETDIIDFQPDDYADYQKMDSDIKYLITPWASVEFTSLVIEEGITVIGASAFFHCYNLETVTLPRGLKKIRPFAFRACKSIKKVIMPPEAITIERAAFENCANLETVELPSGSFVNHEAFKNCPKLKKNIL